MSAEQRAERGVLRTRLIELGQRRQALQAEQAQVETPASTETIMTTRSPPRESAESGYIATGR